MLRRVVAVVVLAGLSVGVGLPLRAAAGGADAARTGAVRLIAANGKRLTGEWQSWANASLMPTVAGQVVVEFGGCPALPKVAGCVYTRQPRVIYLKQPLAHARGVMLHELGHVYDLTVLSHRDREEFRRIMRRPNRQWWKGKVPLAEWFAEAYSWCARYSRIESVADYAIYGYDPTPNQHRSTCALIRRAARDDTPPKPPDQPPVVTGDPAAPAAPPLTPAAVTGDPARDPGPVAVSPSPAPTATATPRATRTPRPTATDTPTPAPTAVETPTAAPTEEPAATPTATPEDTPAPIPAGEPTATPTPAHDGRPR